MTRRARRSGQQLLGSGDADTDTDCYKCMRGSDQCHNAAHVAEFDLITLLLHRVRGLWHLQNLPLYPHIVIYLIRPLNADWSQQRRSCFKAQWVNHTCQTFYNVCCTILGEVLVAQVHANAKFLLLFLLGYKTQDKARLATAAADWNCKLS